MHVLGGGIKAGPLVDDRLQVAVIVDVLAGNGQVEHVLVAEHPRLAGLGQHDELVRQVAADRAGLGAHGDSLQAHAGEGAQIGHEHPVVRAFAGRLVEVEGIGVLHVELAPAHDAEAGPLLVPELPLHVVEVQRQAPVAVHIGPEDLGDHLLVGGPVEQLALVAVLDAQHLSAIVVIASGLAPQVGQLQGGHEQLHGPGPVHLFADDLLDLLQHAEAQRQPGVDPGGLLAEHARPQHQPMRHDLRFGRRLLQDRQEITGQAHRDSQGWKERQLAFGGFGWQRAPCSARRPWPRLAPNTRSYRPPGSAKGRPEDRLRPVSRFSPSAWWVSPGPRPSPGCTEHRSPLPRLGFRLVG